MIENNNNIFFFVFEGLGERLRTFRKGKELSQKEFSEICGIAQTGLSNIEKGRRGMSNKVIFNLSNHFPDFDAHYILTGKKKEVETAPTEGVENDI